MTQSVSFTVPGQPISQGSMVALRSRNPGDNRVFMKPSNEKALKEYRGLVRQCAFAAGSKVFEGPVSMDIRFTLTRPKGHFGTGRNEGVRKDSAPDFPIKKPDIDKLVRAILDALTGTCFGDDAQVVQLEVRKDYQLSPQDPPCAFVRVRKLQEAAA